MRVDLFFEMSSALTLEQFTYSMEPVPVKLSYKSQVSKVYRIIQLTIIKTRLNRDAEFMPRAKISSKNNTSPVTPDYLVDHSRSFI